ncbi:MAG: hypothetical protein Q9190_005034 [Brigantiaea leucoxantha]
MAGLAPIETLTSSSSKHHVLIIGAGITGLCLAQALKKNDVPFSVFERDPTVSARGKGWGLTIHWGLDTFLSLLPQHIIDRLPEVYVNPEASQKGENGNFLFFDLRSGETRYKVPPSKRIRVSRERLRALLLDGLDVQWSKTLTSISTPSSDSITAHFSDSTASTGTLLVGADGTRSATRSLLLSPSCSLSDSPSPNSNTNVPLPVRLLGTSTSYPPSLGHKIHALDPFFFQGGDPFTSAFHYFSFLSVPSNLSSSLPLPGTHTNTNAYECQIIISYPFRPGFLSRSQPLEIPSSNSARVALMKEIADGWAEPFREYVAAIPEDAEVKTIALEDFVPKEGMWSNQEGRMTMVGDAAHAMTMFRGEAANHGITDVAIFLSNVLPLLRGGPPDKNNKVSSLKEGVDAYEKEMISRTAPAVLTSRKACMDAHDYESINDQSPLVSRRVMVTEE